MDFQELPIIGKLTLSETYEFYDRPVLFTCKTPSGLTYLAVWADEDEVSETWLYVAMSERRFQQVRSGAIDLRDAFRLAEDGQIFVVHSRGRDTAAIEVQLTPPELIDDELLPDAGERLNLATSTLPKIENDIAELATQSNRDIVRLELDLDGQLRTEIPTLSFSRILSAFQNTVNAIGEFLLGSVRRRGFVPEDIVKKMQFDFLRAGAGSFEIELATSNYGPLFSEFESDAAKAVAQLNALLNASKDPDTLRSLLTTFGHRVASQHLLFLEAVNDNASSLQLVRATPKSGIIDKSRITKEDARLAIDLIRQLDETVSAPFRVHGILMGANVRMKKFEIFSEVDKKSYAGNVLYDAEGAVFSATLSKEYVATIRDRVGINPMTGDVQVHHELLGLQPFGWAPAQTIQLL